MKRISTKAAAGLMMSASVLTLNLSEIPQTWAVSGDVQIELNQSSYNKGDRVEAKVTIKSNDGANFLLQSKISVSSGLSISSVTGDNINYNNGTIVGTAPQSQFEIKIVFDTKDTGEQTFALSQIKLGATDGSQNQIIDIQQKSVMITPPPVVETQSDRQEQPSESTTENIEIKEEQDTLNNDSADSIQEDKEIEVEPVERYEPWTAVVYNTGALNVREGPGFNYIIKSQLGTGAKVTVTEEQEASGNIWCHIEIGWCSKDYLKASANITPELSNKENKPINDDEIEKAQQAAIQQQATQQEAANQANNNAAQQRDTDKKNSYDAQEQQSFPQNQVAYPDPTVATETIEPVESENTNVETILNTNNAQNTNNEILTNMSNNKKWSMGTFLPYESNSRYIGYKADEMNVPFYFDLEAYNGTFPDEYQKTVLSMNGLSFTAAIPEDKAKRESNVFLIYGSFDNSIEPQLYLFDKSNNNFFLYNKIHEEITNTTPMAIPTSSRRITPSTFILSATSLAAAYIVGSIVASSRLLFISKHGKRKKQGKAKEIPISPSVAQFKKPAEVYDMSDEEFEQLLKEYGADSKSVQKSGQFNIEGTSPAKTVDWLSDSTVIMAPSVNNQSPTKVEQEKDLTTMLVVEDSKLTETSIKKDDEIKEQPAKANISKKNKNAQRSNKNKKNTLSNLTTSSQPVLKVLTDAIENNKSNSTQSQKVAKSRAVICEDHLPQKINRCSEIEASIGDTLDNALKASELRNTGRLPTTEIIEAAARAGIKIDIPNQNNELESKTIETAQCVQSIKKDEILPDVKFDEPSPIESETPTILESLFVQTLNKKQMDDDEIEAEFDRLMAQADNIINS